MAGEHDMPQLVYLGKCRTEVRKREEGRRGTEGGFQFLELPINRRTQITEHGRGLIQMLAEGQPIHTGIGMDDRNTFLIPCVKG